jgi:hypothetical protein
MARAVHSAPAEVRWDIRDAPDQPFRFAPPVAALTRLLQGLNRPIRSRDPAGGLAGRIKEGEKESRVTGGQASDRLRVNETEPPTEPVAHALLLSMIIPGTWHAPLSCRPSGITRLVYQMAGSRHKEKVGPSLEVLVTTGAGDGYWPCCCRGPPIIGRPVIRKAACPVSR